MESVYFMIEPGGDEVVRPVEAWRQRSLAPVTCSLCWNVLPRYRSQPIDVDLDWDGYPDHMMPVLYRMALMVLRDDLCEALSGQMRGFAIGRALLLGVASERYRSVIVPSSHRCRLCADDASVFRPCPECGRRLGSPPGGEEWLDAAQVAGRPLVGLEHGGRLLLSVDAIAALPPSVRSELSFGAVRVRECR